MVFDTSLVAATVKLSERIEQITNDAAIDKCLRAWIAFYEHAAPSCHNRERDSFGHKAAEYATIPTDGLIVQCVVTGAGYCIFWIEQDDKLGAVGFYDTPECDNVNKNMNFFVVITLLISHSIYIITLYLFISMTVYRNYGTCHH